MYFKHQTFNNYSLQKWVIQKVNVYSSYLLAETEGPQEGLHIIKLSVTKALQPLRVTGLSGQTHCTDLVGRKEKKQTETENYIVSLT